MTVKDIPFSIFLYHDIVGDNFDFACIFLADETREDGTNQWCHPTGIINGDRMVMPKIKLPRNDDEWNIAVLTEFVELFEPWIEPHIWSR